MEVFQYIARSLLMPQPCELKPVTGAQLKKKIMSMKQNRAVALDGWRIPELRFLPKSWYELVASCFGAIEQGAPWPETCCLATISTIPKGAVNTQDQNPRSHSSGSKWVGYKTNHKLESFVHCVFRLSLYRHARMEGKLALTVHEWLPA